MSLLSIIAMTFLIGVCITYALIKAAPYIGLTDDAGKEARKQHTGSPALIGGLSIVLTFVVSLFISGVEVPAPLMIGLMAFLFLGAYDDAKHIPALVKLLLQVVIVLVVVTVFGVQIEHIGPMIEIDTVVYLQKMAAVFSFICIIFFINAMNLIDGLDGFAGSIALSCFSVYAYIAHISGFESISILFAIAAAAAAGFLMFNMRGPHLKSAKTFLGDGGSLSLAFLMGWGAITLGNMSGGEHAVLPDPMFYTFVLAYPMFDMFSVMFMRKMKKRPLFDPDNMHLHFMLKEAFGWSVGKRAFALIFLNAVYTLCGWGAIQMGLFGLHLGFLWLGLFACHLSFNLYVVRKNRITV